ncbi:TauD/TfdA dioxygenase family protein [Actinomadura formosensis]|uniref:TauD/TfdA dioxygenase family protein n=1 Tax=Actinomadura formosensis TaxID=60706 RepID=UPI00082DDD7B|nr:TauD/TfdA family dioxygenase [Actinomadura formosensis]
MEVVPLKAALGAELRGVDLTEPLDDRDVETVRNAFADHFLLVVRDQRLSGEDQDRFVRYLGPLQRFDNGAYHQFMTNQAVENAAEAGSGRLLFHNDGAYRERPRAGTSLYAIDVSPTSPPTSFANGVRAYELLPGELRRRIESLSAVHILDYDDPEQESNRVREADFPAGRTLADVRHAVHPMVVTLPHSDRKAVFVSEFYTSHIKELGPTSEEGEDLLQQVFKILYQESNVHSHHYRNGDLVVWDNHAAQHARSGSVDSNPRHLRRLVLDRLSWSRTA